MTNKFFALVIVFFLPLMSSTAWATAQFGEVLLYEGKEHALRSLPDLPFNNPRFRYLTFEERESASKKEEYFSAILHSTACWRQYQGTWEIQNDRLYLIKIIGKYALVGTEPMFANWFSGELRVPMDNRPSNLLMGLDMVIQIREGLVIKIETIDNTRKS